MKRMKQSLCWLLTLAMLFSMMAGLVVGVAAEDGATGEPTLIASGSCGDKVTYEFRDDTPGDNKPSGVLTIKGEGPMADYKQIATMETDTPWYNAGYRYDIKKVVIESGVTTVGSFAFFNLIKCSEVLIPTGVVSIGEWAFAYTALTKVDLPVTLENVRHFAFYKTSLLKDGKNSTCAGFPSIDNENYGSSSTNYELVNDLDSASQGNVVVEASGTLCNGIDWKYSGASKTLTISSSYDGVMDTQIYTMIDMQITSTNPEPWPWNAYMAAIEKVYITKGIANIGQYVLAALPSLKAVTLGDHVQTIETHAFDSAVSLKASINLPEATTTVENYAFGSCPGPIILISPKTKAEAGDGFSKVGNSGVTYQYADDENTPVSPSNPTAGMLSNGKIKWTFIEAGGILYIEPADVNSEVAMPHFIASTSAPWAAHANNIKMLIIQSGITEIGKYNFADLPNLRTVTFPDTLTIIYEHAFEHDTSIARLDFPKDLHTIRAYAFDGCNGLTAATTPRTFLAVDKVGNTRLYELLFGGGVTPPTSGSCGDSATWNYDSTNKTLTVFVYRGKIWK